MFTATAFLQAQAPSYKDFEWDVIKLGYVLPGGGEYSSGGLGGGELRLNLRDDLSIGLRTESATFDHAFDDDEFEVEATWSWAATADYYFNTSSPYRTFAGLGFGSFTEGDIKGKDDDVIIRKGITSSGLVTRVGYEYGHLRISAEYNIMMKEEGTNYFTFSAALTLWGGYTGNRYSSSPRDSHIGM
jgi:outer membrane protein X